jgi:hypothetical protein
MNVYDGSLNSWKGVLGFLNMVEMLVLIYSGVSSLHMFTYSTYDVTTCVLSIIFSVQVGFFLNIQMESH